MIAKGQLEAHQAKLAQYEALKESFRDIEIPEGPRLTLRAGIVHEREFAKFWSSLL
jgi:hypothetical protein